MILTELKAFLKKNKVTNMFYLVTYLNAEPDAIRDMIEKFIEKGQVQKVEQTSHHCGKCGQCHPLMLEVYEWIGGEDSEASSAE